MNANERYVDTSSSVPRTWATPYKSCLGAPPALSYLEKFAIKRVRKLANEYPDKLHMDQLITKKNLELHLRYPQGKWPSVPCDPLVVRALVHEDPLARLSL